LPSQQRLKKDNRSNGLLFERGYNDLIAKGYDMLPRMTAYINDNPRRLTVKRAHPDNFRVRFDIEVGGQTYAAIGNRFLLHHPEKVQVQLSRSLTDEQINERVQYYLSRARQGAILVSPAISTSSSPLGGLPNSASLATSISRPAARADSSFSLLGSTRTRRFP
jgi:hypothetical protein